VEYQPMTEWSESSSSAPVYGVFFWYANHMSSLPG